VLDITLWKVEYLHKEDYYLKFEAPEGKVFTFANASFDEDKDSDVTHAMGLNTTNIISFNPGDEIFHVDAGIISGVLPLQWKDISVERLDRHHALTWITSRELNVDYFEVQRKLENEEDFLAIGQVKAVGNSLEDQKYLFDDQDIVLPGEYYYRVKQYDIDGKSTYSDIVVTKQSIVKEIVLHPNPTSNYVNVNGNFDSEITYEIKVVDKLGRVVYRSLDVNERIDMSDLSNGVYTVIIKNQNTVLYTDRIIKI